MGRTISAIGACAALTAAAPIAQNHFATQPKADDVFYHIMPIAWRDGIPDPDRLGDLVGIRDGLAYLADTGFTAFWLNPVFPSPAYHGYQHGRADEINPRFGTEQDFLDLIAAANDLGIETYIDFVVYGISHDSPWFQSASNNPFSPFDGWLAFENFPNTQYLGATFPTWNADTVGFIHWDLRNPAVANLVISWAEKWLDPDGDGDPSDGVAGYRLDHVWVNYCCGPDGWGYNLDTFWADWHAALRAVNPSVFTFAEQADWGSHGGEFLTQFDAAMTKPFEFAARDALWNEHAGALYFQMEQTIQSLPDATPGTYVAIIGDHDVDRLASAIGADSAATRGRAEAAAAVLMLQPFPPIVYYGDEIAMLGTKQQYFSDADDIPMREPFKWTAQDSAVMSAYHTLNPLAFANQFSSDFDGRSVEEQQTSGPLHAYTELIAHRHANVALRRGDYHAIAATDAPIWAFLRSYYAGEAPIPDATQTVVALVNLSGAPISTTIDLSAMLPGSETLAPTNLANAGALSPLSAANAAAYPVTVPAYSYALFEAPLSRPRPPRIVLDGTLDPFYTEVATTIVDSSLWAALDGSTLYLATNPAGDGFDRFIALAETPGPLQPAMWAKTGEVAAVDAFVGNENDNNWSGWFDANAPLGTASGAVLEAAIDLTAEYGALPPELSLAAFSFHSPDGDVLFDGLSVPLVNLNGNVDPEEFVAVTLADVAIPDSPCEFAAPFGTPDALDVQTYLSLVEARSPAAEFTPPSQIPDAFDQAQFFSAVAHDCP